MFQFCFNDSIPKDGTNDGLVSHLSITLEHYNSIKKEFPKSVNGIITDRLPKNVILNSANFTLEDCIHYLNRELKKIALSNFGKYPVDNYYDQINTDDLIKYGYFISINNIELDGLNAKIVADNGGILFTLPIHNDLKKHTLIISDNEKNNCEVSNQFGDLINTALISDFIKADLVKSTNGFDKLLAIVGECDYDSRFKSDFENLTSVTQTFLLKEIEYAINRKAKTRFYPDDKLIKKVTPFKEKEIEIFELRIYSPVAIRMYFYETPSKIYFGSIDGKPKKKVQDNDILNAASVIKELLALEKN